MINTRIMHGLEYKSFDGSRTFDIFDSFKSAEKYAEKIKTFNKQYAPIFIFRAEFSLKRIFKEKGGWNYDDHSDTFSFNRYKILKYF